MESKTFTLRLAYSDGTDLRTSFTPLSVGVMIDCTRDGGTRSVHPTKQAREHYRALLRAGWKPL